MDFSFILVFVIAAVVSIMVPVTLTKARKTDQRLIAFALSFLLAMILARPWEQIPLAEWQVLVVVCFMVAFWVSLGILAGGAIGNRLNKGAGRS